MTRNEEWKTALYFGESSQIILCDMICVKIDKNEILTTTTTTVGIQKPDMSYFRIIEKKTVME